ncbi:MAG: hypothetical protein SVY10_21560 [Thermodesulfobacteriota bacterium]|nr:hypothetical protein [Thermodesulfobacteriota bacterium]
MTYVEDIFLWLRTVFTIDVYMISTKIQGILWSIADVILVFFLLKISDIIRTRTGKRRIISRYVLLYLTAFATPLLVFTKTPHQFFLLESIVCGTQFAILVYTIFAERRGAMDFFRHIKSNQVTHVHNSSPYIGRDT